jgi:anti-sigma28 factor (negative regulator of flagellin synthesis)
VPIKNLARELARRMRVNDRNLTGATPAESGRAQNTEKLDRNQGVRAGTAATDRTGDRVELSSTLETLSRAMSAYRSERSHRVQALAGQFQSGSYHPDSAATARGMVPEALLAEGQ